MGFSLFPVWHVHWCLPCSAHVWLVTLMSFTGVTSDTLNTIQSNLCAPTSQVCSPACSMFGLPRVTPLQKTHSSFPRRYCMPRAPQVGVGLDAHLLPAVPDFSLCWACSGLLHVSQPLWVPTHSFPFVYRKQWLRSSHVLPWLLQ